MTVLRRLALAGVVWLCVLAGGLVFGCVGAWAGETRLLEGSFGPDGTAASVFTQPASVAVDQTSGDVYVEDAAAGTVEKFDSSHTPVEWGGLASNIEGSRLTGFSFSAGPPLSEMAVNSLTHVLYVVDHGSESLRAFQASGEPALFTAGPGAGTNTLGGFGELCGVAVDSSGDIYASDFFTGIEVYAPSGELLKLIPGSFFKCSLAVGAGGVVYAGGFEGAVSRFVPSVFPVTASTTYEFGGTVDEASSWGVAVDPASNHLLVDEHSQVGEYDEAASRLATFGETGAPGELAASEGVAVDGVSDHVYVSDTGGGHQVEIFGPEVVLADVVTGEASEVQPRSARLSGSVNPDGVELTGCTFAVVDSAHYNPGAADPYAAGTRVPCAESTGVIGAGSEPVPVHADLSGLQVGTTYHFRLEASNASTTAKGADGVFATQPPPSIDGVSVANLTASAGDLTAEIDPNGLETTYLFEYGTSTEYGSRIPTSPQPIGAGSADVSKTQHITGLAPDTVYHWRVIASNAAGTTTGVDHTFIYPTGGRTALPDGRAYEMVTPAHKNGALLGSVFLGPSPGIAEDGSRVVLSTLQCFEETSCPASRGPVGTQYAFTRTPTGWQASSLAPPATEYDINSVWALSVNDGAGIYSMPTAPAGEDDFYARHPDGSFSHIGPVSSPSLGAEGPRGSQGFYHLVTGDLSHFVYEEEFPVWPSLDENRSEAVYEYSGSGSQPSLVGVSGERGSTDLISSCATTLNQPGNGNESLSADGRIVYFSAEACGSGTGVNEHTAVPADTLYARIDEAETIKISARSPGDCTSEACLGSPPGDAAYQGSSADGRTAFFTDTQQLTDTASEDSNPGDTARFSGCARATGMGCNLYEYSLDAPTAHRLVAVSAGDLSGGGPRVQGVVAVSKDGTHVYFVAKGVLTGVANGSGEVARDGEENLYVYERDSAHPDGLLRFVTVLSSAHKGELGADSTEWESGVGVADVTSDGRFLLFRSQRALTPDDSRTTDIGAAQVFRYDAQTGVLMRVSVGEQGFNDSGNAGVGDAHIVPGTAFQSFAGKGTRNPSMSNDGSYVFFMSPVGLTTGALNDVPIGKAPLGTAEYAQNVYEYHDGHVSLISDGHDVSVEPPPVAECQNSISAVCLVGVSGSGRDVFFTTSDPLVSQDTDTQLDYYDARVCSVGDPCVSAPPEGLAACDGEACHGIPAQAPGVPAGGSATFSGPGNEKQLSPVSARVKQCRGGLVRKGGSCVKAAKRCRRGFVRKHGLCVRVKSAKRVRRAVHRSRHVNAGRSR
jgi:hypothetical protein